MDNPIKNEMMFAVAVSGIFREYYCIKEGMLPTVNTVGNIATTGISGKYLT